MSVGQSVDHSLVKVLVTILTQLGWGKPLNHNIWWVNIGSGSVRMPKYLPCGDEFYNGWCNAVDQRMLWESLMVYDNFWDVTVTSYISVVSVVSIMTHQQRWTPSDLLWISWCFPGGESSQLSNLCMDTGMMRKTVPSHRICLLSASSFILFNTQLLPWVMGVHLLCTLAVTANGRRFESSTINIPVSQLVTQFS